ncbi:polysaccharide ABC transporter ATP-binding protein [Blastopirellula sp. JC732]|uniref:Polysaccharide ABC transporter ATP-binding protein n=1 Tax=Blastopirellula sediminis TaxID=2894196 RepID=A0A9X1MKF8_9BACT|nr:polysaccharide ABC transporter ATP-binding protein [Blastopirellula sediminis]MCC9608445.1 polysaccharide ABC transporter ATP-binding protein [Blastopirellula sediminis]MCC9628778.1 polysaccharide ABC transporter ATP-binding protein [Blastopirellula sediminis]
MSHIAIRVENIGKRYRRGSAAPYQRFSEMLQRVPAAVLDAARGAFQAKSQTDDQSEFWALKDVSFDVKEGEVLGVIGRNGAGKSTLLKILSRITEPTTGRFGVRGRLASLLEVGTGFHPELTGRENIYLSGAILGMSRAEIKRRFDEIVAFAEIDEALDTPVKRYSSGMYVRLGFAIAAHLQPEILIVDEVLAVGDAAFQKKCLGKMGEVANSGRTVLFVSHNMTAVERLCTSAVYLEHGEIHSAGDVADVLKRYLNGTDACEESRGKFDAWGNDRVKLHGARAYRNCGDDHSQRLTVADEITLEFDVSLSSENVVLTPSLIVNTSDAYPAFNVTPADNHLGTLTPLQSGRQFIRCRIPENLLNNGEYSATLYIIRDGSQPEFMFDQAIRFEVDEHPQKKLSWFGKRVGATRPLLNWEISVVEQDLSVVGNG